jgi:phospholipid/cholesterol/gamma-HCH transport system ATP-binding protein
MIDTDAHIIVSDLTMAYGDFVVQRDLNFDVRRGEVFVIMGGSGCGKTTLLRHIIGLQKPDTGRIFLGEDDIWAADPDDREHMMRRFGVLYQGGALWTSMTLAENVAVPLTEYTDLSPADVRRVVSMKLVLVGLAGFEDFYPSELSGGMRKRAGLARAMALDPEILCFDEPSAGLDPISARRLDELILHLRDGLGSTVLVVTHELDSIFTIADRAILLDTDARTIIAEGNPTDMRERSDDERVLRFLTRGGVREELVSGEGESARTQQEDA